MTSTTTTEIWGWPVSWTITSGPSGFTWELKIAAQTETGGATSSWDSAEKALRERAKQIIEHLPDIQLSGEVAGRGGHNHPFRAAYKVRDHASTVHLTVEALSGIIERVFELKSVHRIGVGADSRAAVEAQIQAVAATTLSSSEAS